jgi:trk system potassium uptake protein
MRERVLLREELGSGGLGSVFLLARKIMLYTLVAEIAGAGILSVAFLGEVDPPQAVWWGVFHAISAFNNAGFDVFGGFRSLVPFNQRPEVLLPIALLFIAGGISYAVVEDVVQRRRFVRLTLDSKLVLVTTAALLVLGTAGVLFAERANQATLGGHQQVEPRLPEYPAAATAAPQSYA